jgi:NAD(P)-dependent dehydrogenase (short-subunit alcohol dehydrogenase family)
VSLGGDFGFGGAAPTPEGGAIAGLLKAIHIEDSRRDDSRVRVKVIDAKDDESDDSLVDSLFWELAGREPEVEVCWSQGERRVIRPIPAPLDARGCKPIPRGGVWVVTGGARGITAIAARELARRYGWKLHLIGKSPAPRADAPWRGYSDGEMKTLKTTLARQAVSEGRSPSEAWDRVMKDVEIFNNLQQFVAAGVNATYHACDIGDREALAEVLVDVRRQDGPIQGVMHGAGVIDPSRFESKRRDILRALVGAKVDGTLNLMALTEQDPLTCFIGFGSISGRFGGNGLTDYAAGNDALAKLIDWHRAHRPACASTCVHWESWEGSGMATLPRFAWGPKSVMNMKYMLPEEGVRRLEQELEAGLPDSEVLYTFGDFYPMFYPREQRPLGVFDPTALLARTDAAKSESWPLVVNMRREMGGATADLPLDPLAEAFLVQHRLRNKPLMPVVVGLEGLAEVARAAGGGAVVGFDNVQMLDGLMFHTDRSLLAQVRAVAKDDGAFACELTCDFRNRSGGLIQKDRPYLRADVRVGEKPASVAAVPEVGGAWTEFSYPDDAPVYHGPVFRGVNGICCDRQGGWGRIVSLPLVDLVGPKRVADWAVPSCVLDAALYACGIHLWTHETGAVSLPKAIDHLQLGRAARDGETCLVHFVCRDISADSACYDFTLVGQDGQLIVAAQGYRKVILARGGIR